MNRRSEAKSNTRVLSVTTNINELSLEARQALRHNLAAMLNGVYEGTGYVFEVGQPDEQQDETIDCNQLNNRK